jgi:hypothetical protein
MPAVRAPAALLSILTLAALGFGPSGCADEPAASASTPRRFPLEITRVEAPVAVPGSRLRVVGSGFLDAGVWTARLVGALAGAPLERPLTVDRRDDAVLELVLTPSTFSGLPEGTFEGRLELEVVYGESTGEATPAVRFEVRSGLDPVFTRGAPGAFPQSPWPVDAQGLLTPSEGQTTIALRGRFLPDGVGSERELAVTEVPVVALDPTGLDRSRGQVEIELAWFGIEPGRFEGEAALTNSGQGWTRGSPFVPVRFDLLVPTIEQVTPRAASRGQRVTIFGQGFVGGSQGATTLRLDGTFTPRDGEPTSLPPGGLELNPTWLSGNELVFSMRVDYDFDCNSADLGARPGRLEGQVTPIIELEGTRVEGVTTPLDFEILPSRQLVYLRFLPAFTDSLRLFGLRNLSADVQDRILEVLHRDYAGINVDFRTLEPEDFLDYAILEFGGPDPNGQNLFGLDNTPDLDRCNERLGDNLAGRNADGAGYGGIFVESFLQLSPANGADNPLASPGFDEVFGEVMRAPATPDDLFGPRAEVVRRAVLSLGNLIGSTASHEVGHSLGLPVFPGCGDYHTAPGDAQLMDCGADRPFAERVELNGAPPGRFNPEDLEYLRQILPL